LTVRPSNTTLALWRAKLLATARPARNGAPDAVVRAGDQNDPVAKQISGRLIIEGQTHCADVPCSIAASAVATSKTNGCNTEDAAGVAKVRRPWEFG